MIVTAVKCDWCGAIHGPGTSLLAVRSWRESGGLEVESLHHYCSPHCLGSCILAEGSHDAITSAKNVMVDDKGTRDVQA